MWSCVPLAGVWLQEGCSSAPPELLKLAKTEAAATNITKPSIQLVASRCMRGDDMACGSRSKVSVVHLKNNKLFTFITMVYNNTVTAH